MKVHLHLKYSLAIFKCSSTSYLSYGMASPAVLPLPALPRPLLLEDALLGSMREGQA